MEVPIDTGQGSHKMSGQGGKAQQLSGQGQMVPRSEAGWQCGKSVGFGEKGLIESWLHVLAL